MSRRKRVIYCRREDLLYAMTLGFAGIFVEGIGKVLKTAMFITLMNNHNLSYIIVPLGRQVP